MAPLLKFPRNPRAGVGPRVVQFAEEEGLIVRFLAGAVASLCPPLIISGAEIDTLFERFRPNARSRAGLAEASTSSVIQGRGAPDNGATYNEATPNEYGAKHMARRHQNNQSTAEQPSQSAGSMASCPV